jgi:prophage antirepressor-like protein
MQNQQISFENTPVNIIHKDGKVWLTLTDVARCLYGISEDNSVSSSTDKVVGRSKSINLEDAKRSIERIFKKKRETIEKRGDTQLIKYKEGEVYRKCRIFSRSGLYSIAFAALTPKAEAFQNFVLDLLEKYDNGQQPVSVAPVPEEQPMIEKTVITQEDVTNEFRMACNYLLPVMDNFRAYKELWETRTILIHSAPRQALALNDALGGLYERILEDVQSSYTTMRDMITGKKLKAKPNADISIHHVLERMSQKTK